MSPYRTASPPETPKIQRWGATAFVKWWARRGPRRWWFRCASCNALKRTRIEKGKPQGLRCGWCVMFGSMPKGKTLSQVWFENL